MPTIEGRKCRSKYIKILVNSFLRELRPVFQFPVRKSGAKTVVALLPMGA